jgi:hypothetical protein
VYNSNVAAVGFGGMPMPNVVFRNNIFICSGDAVSGETERGRFENNIYWSADGRELSFDGHATLREWAEATGQEKVGDEVIGRYVDPKLAKAGTKMPVDPAELTRLATYRLRPDSPCLKAGIPIEDNGGRDFWGHRLPRGERPAIGTCEKP